MIPATQDIKLTRGDNFSIYLRIKRKSDGAYIDITGYAFLAQIRPDPDSDTILATMTVTISDQTAFKGGVLLSLDKTITAGLTFTGPEREKVIGVWDLQITNTNGEASTYLDGSVTLRKDVSKLP